MRMEILGLEFIYVPAAEALELTAQSRCLAPTAPDSLACVPFCCCCCCCCRCCCCCSLMRRVGLLLLLCRCYPFVEEDPFCISGSASYHVYFAGLQQQHEHCRIETSPAAEATGAAAEATGAAAAGEGPGPVAVCVPDFAVNGEIVLLSLKTLESKTLRFAEAQPTAA